MMTTTHALIGLAVSTLVIFKDPSLLVYGLSGGLIGGIFPDLDLAFKHRKTLHYPFYYTLAGVISVAIFLATTSALTVFIACFLVSASIHTLSDIFSGGLAPKRYKETFEAPVYDHIRDKWISKNLVRYDGSIEDIIINLSAGIIVIYMVESYFNYIAITLIGLSSAYFIFRMRFHRFSLKILDIEVQE